MQIDRTRKSKREGLTSLPESKQGAYHSEGLGLSRLFATFYGLVKMLAFLFSRQDVEEANACVFVSVYLPVVTVCRVCLSA